LDYLSACRNVAADHGCVMASDECYADIFPSRGAPPPSLLQTAPNPTAPDLTGIIVAFSLSKRSGMTGYRSGALVGDEHLIATQRVLRPNIGTASPTFVQHAAAAAWADDVHVERRRDTFEAKRQVLLDFLNGEGFEVSGSQATFYLWVRAPGGDDQAYAKALLKHRVIVSPGTAFGAEGTGWLRLALVPDVAGCHDAVAAWRAAINDGSLPGHDGASDK
jgi:aspartate/methionine/tyrosine aminotransferase